MPKVKPILIPAKLCLELTQQMDIFRNLLPFSSIKMDK